MFTISFTKDFSINKKEIIERLEKSIDSIKLLIINFDNIYKIR